MYFLFKNGIYSAIAAVYLSSHLALILRLNTYQVAKRNPFYSSPSRHYKPPYLRF